MEGIIVSGDSEQEMSYRFEHAICNEVYGLQPFADVCRDVKAAGYDGIEIAPFTLAESPAAIAPETRRECRERIIGEGLRFVGLHWLMVSPAGLHVTSPDRNLRKKSWAHIVDLIDLCADLSTATDSRLMIFGSPKQRCAVDGLTPAEAKRNYIEGLAGVAPHALSRGVTILVEALPSNQCDVITSLAEAVEVVKEIGHPAVRTMFDTHNAVEETEPHEILVDRYWDFIRHVHVNEMDGKRPGTGGYDFRPLLSILSRRSYSGFVSLEAFDFSEGAGKIARESLRFLEKEIAQI
jgi:sugar phosphate isomerase/epimerase